MITATISKEQYDKSINYYDKSFDLVTNVAVEQDHVILHFTDESFDEWYDDYTDATVAIGFDVAETGEPTDVGLFMERIHDTVFNQVQQGE